MSKQISDYKLGILGGGQLGRMLIQQATNYNAQIHILDPDPDAPCKNLCTSFECGSLTDFDTVYQFGKKVDVITIEIEKVNVDALELLEKEGKQVFPQSRVIRLIQDKGLQKQFFKENEIPTATFQQLSWAEITEEKLPFGFPMIVKLRKDGYDGKGVQKVNSFEELKNSFEAPCIIEECVPFEKEIAVIVARNVNGDVKTFPMVEMEFNPEANLVEFLISPSTYPMEVQTAAEQIAMQIAQNLSIVGLLAVEMFVLADGSILVNEVAPRPHNSGHHTIEGNGVSQFEQHLRAIFDMPLGNTQALQHAVMVNVLGEAGHEGTAKYEGLNDILKLSGVYVHLYGKKYTKPFRKMGHVTITDNDRDSAIEKARFVQKTLKVIS